jgi:hypothetical protein
MKHLQKLNRTKMKMVFGGNKEYNPNCGETNPTADWTCCKATSYEHIGETDCDTASSLCSGYMVTNDPSRCN